MALRSDIPGALSISVALPLHFVSLKHTWAFNYLKHSRESSQYSMYSAIWRNSPSDFQSHPSTVPQVHDTLAPTTKRSQDVVSIRSSPGVMLCSGTTTIHDIRFHPRLLRRTSIPSMKVPAFRVTKQNEPCPLETIVLHEAFHIPPGFVEPTTVQRWRCGGGRANIFRQEE